MVGSDFSANIRHVQEFLGVRKIYLQIVFKSNNILMKTKFNN